MKRRYLNYSLVFYDREDSLKEIQNRVNEGFSNLDRIGTLVSKETLDKFKKFNALEIAGQRDLIQKPDGIGYINMLFEILNGCNHDNFLLMYIVPTIDGIILGRRNRKIEIRIERVILKSF